MSATVVDNLAAIRALESLPRPVIGFANDYPVGAKIPPHSHRRAQLVHAVQGVMTLRTEEGLWVVPPGRGVWVPAGMVHAIDTAGQLRMRALFLDPASAKTMAARCRAVSVSPLLRELILAFLSRAPLYDLDGPDGRLVQVILDELGRLEDAPLHLPMPRDRRARRVAEGLLADPGNDRALSDWAAAAGASSRTLARAFVTETGMSFGSWRRQVRLLRALALLAEGRPVTTVALDLGYESPSAFVAMFRRVLGAPPGRYLRAMEE